MSQRRKATFDLDPAIQSVPTPDLITGRPEMIGLSEAPVIGDATNASRGPGIASGFPQSGAGSGGGMVSKPGAMGGSAASPPVMSGGFLDQVRK
ncbi:MAG: hypothetical protein ACLQIB_13670 [Isosphaeraceae bacterium]